MPAANARVPRHGHRNHDRPDTAAAFERSAKLPEEAGIDLGTFVSLYRASGGQGELEESALPEVYGQAVSDLAHLRLGPV
jgi:hypothetical protein